jgi:hypothetical protein
MSSLDGPAIEQLIKDTIERQIQDAIARQFALIAPSIADSERQFALIAPVHERNIQAVETFGQTVANLVEQEGQLQAEVTRLDKAIDTTHAANQAVREQDKQELLEKQANVERAQNELQKTMAQHDEWIHKRYTDSIETGATKLINAFDESRVKPLDDEVRALRAAVDGRPQQADITKLIGEQMLAKTKEHVHLQQQSSKLLLEMEKLRGNEEKLQKKSEETAKQVMQLELELDKLRGNEVAQQSQEKHEALLQEIEKLCGNEELRIEAVEKIQEALGKPYEQEKLRDNETHELRKSLKELKENYERLRADVCSTNADEGGGSCADVCSTNADEGGGSCADVCTENYERLRADVCSTNAGAGGGSCADVCSTENYGQLRADVCSTNDDEVGGSCADGCGIDSASSLADVCNTNENAAGDCQGQRGRGDIGRPSSATTRTRCDNSDKEAFETPADSGESSAHSDAEAAVCRSMKRAIETAMKRAIETAFEKCAIETAFEKRLQAAYQLPC